VKVLLLVLAFLGPVEGLDLAVARSVQEQRRPGLEAPMRAVSSYARPVVVAAGLLVVLGVDLAGGGGWGTLRLAVAALAGTNLAVEVLKRAVDRQRPDGERKRSNSSFPSSHAANAFVLAWVLSSRWRRAAPLFFAVALLVAFSRMYLNRHFLSDVTAGALLGMGVAWACARGLPVRGRAGGGGPGAGGPAGPPGLVEAAGL
jgi:membrane-associated phospholipid phosphatase